MAAESKWRRKSPYSVKKTLDRLEQRIMLNDKILRFARINQADILRADGVASRDCEMLLFENRALAAKMMAIHTEAAFELPIRALAWQDDAGDVWLRVTDPDLLNTAADLQGAGGVITTIHQILGEMVDQTVAVS
jgi:uncharacterized protein (DUF302 family)